MAAHLNDRKLVDHASSLEMGKPVQPRTIDRVCVDCVSPNNLAPSLPLGLEALGGVSIILLVIRIFPWFTSFSSM